MTKEQLLQLVSEAYDEGASVELNIHHIRDRKEAGELADQFAEFFDEPLESGEGNICGWHKYKADKVEFTTYFDKEETICANCQR